MNYLRLILLPLSLLFFIIISFRNLLFNIGILKSQQFNTPIISIGNITTGGTGKTPMVIYLTKYLFLRGKSVGVISRGYKRISNNLVIAHNGRTVTSGVQSTGDELSMIVNRFAGNNKFYAIAYHDRIKAIEVMVNNFSPDIIILDDAFQNRWINKSLDIVIIDKENKSFLNFFMLPAGNLRETSSSLKRADIVFNNFKFSKPTNSKINNHHNIEYSYFGFCDINGNKVEFSNSKEAILVSGIANNYSFHNIVSKHYIGINKIYAFSDHYSYSVADIEKFKADYRDNVVFLTTEKDYIKIREFKDFVTNYPVYFLRIDVILDNIFLENILTKKNII
jgi:tetraacyldisaccharide 4'-kinase